MGFLNYGGAVRVIQEALQASSLQSAWCLRLRLIVSLSCTICSCNLKLLDSFIMCWSWRILYWSTYIWEFFISLVKMKRSDCRVHILVCLGETAYKDIFVIVSSLYGYILVLLTTSTFFPSRKHLVWASKENWLVLNVVHWLFQLESAFDIK